MHEDINVNVSGPMQPTSQYKTVVLKGQAPFTAQVNKPNMKYVIKHDFDLSGENVEIPEGCLLEFDGGSISNGRLILNSNVHIKGKTVFTSNYNVLGAIEIIGDNCSVEDVTFKTQKVSATNFVAGNDGYCAIKVDHAKNVRIKNCNIEYFQYGVSLYNSENCTIEDIRCVGVYDSYTESDFINKSIPSHDNSAYHDAIRLASSHGNVVSNIFYENGGAGCTLVGVSDRNVITNIVCSSIYDNGVYISSGNHNCVDNVNCHIVLGSCVKMRGSYNIVQNSTVKYCNMGFVITPYQNENIDTDQYGRGYASLGSIINGCSAYMFDGWGARININDDKLPYNNTISNCIFKSTIVVEDKGGVYAINSDNIIANNTISCNEFTLLISDYLTEENEYYYGNTINNNIICYTGERENRGVKLAGQYNSILRGNIIQSTNVYLNNVNHCAFDNNIMGIGKIFKFDSVVDAHINYFSLIGEGSGVRPMNVNWIGISNTFDDKHNLIKISDGTEAKSIRAGKSGRVFVLNKNPTTASDEWLNDMGGNNSRPNSASLYAGYEYYNESKKAYETYDGSIWRQSDGNVSYNAKGTTANRPSTTNLNNGSIYFDTTLGKPIWWNGTIWVDATGATV